MEVQRPCPLSGHSSFRLRAKNSVELLEREEEEEEVLELYYLGKERYLGSSS